jgi:ribonuclease HI
MYEAWADGSVRDGNPGIAGFALYVEHDGTPVYKNALILPIRGTNNEAEYEAVLAAIQYLRVINNEREDCTIYTDSQLVHGQVAQNWKCNFDHLRKRRDEAKRLINDLPFSITLRWVKRFKNTIANELAQAITQAEKERKCQNSTK